MRATMLGLALGGIGYNAPRARRSHFCRAAPISGAPVVSPRGEPGITRVSR
jgi:hypothetical protein